MPRVTLYTQSECIDRSRLVEKRDTANARRSRRRRSTTRARVHGVDGGVREG